MMIETEIWETGIQNTGLEQGSKETNSSRIRFLTL
jgi:hypothetical protein